MKKENFVSLILGMIGGVLFALGMCMCLLPEWNAFSQGLIIGLNGVAILIAMLLIRRRMLGKPRITLSKKTVGIIALAAAGMLFFGAGLAMVLLKTEWLISGILVGLLGMVLLVCLIPLIKGLQ